MTSTITIWLRPLSTNLSERLGVDYLDLFLIHWPNPKALRENDAWKAGNAGAWKAMEEAYKEGKVRAIGVSNFMQHHLEALFETAEIVPHVNQILLAPGVPKKICCLLPRA